MKELAVLFFALVFYFSLSWYYPWEELISGMSISPSYIFDCLFVSIILYWKRSSFLGTILRNYKGEVIRMIATSLLAIICISISNFLEFSAPFKYVDHLLVQMIILAPIIEELVFRGAFWKLLEALQIQRAPMAILSTLFFSFSHLSGLLLLPKEFASFIIFQMIYTLGLGLICAKSRWQTNGLMAPILQHFIFNLCFYLAVQNHYI